jgi:hypothetical protein
MVGIIIGIVGIIFFLISVASLDLSEIRQRLFALVAGGGYLMWAGVAKFREA